MAAESTNEVEKKTPRPVESGIAGLATDIRLGLMSRFIPHPEYQYLGLMREIIKNGVDRAMHVPRDQGIRCELGAIHYYNLQKDGLPILTTKDVAWRSVKYELKWFLNGDTNIKYLVDNGVPIWNEDAYKRYQRSMRAGDAPKLSTEEYVARIKADDEFAQKWGDLGPIYGAQWRRWKNPYGGETDQVQWLVNQLRDPIQRYRKSILVSAWNPSYLPEIAPSQTEEMALPPCHNQFQVDVDEQDRLSLTMYQRSCDMFLGVPFNITSYALLTHLLAQVSGLEAYQFIHMMENVHVYHNHFAAAQEQIKRKPYPFPRLKLNPDIKEIDDFQPDDAKLEGYKHHPKLKADMTSVGGRIDDPVLKP